MGISKTARETEALFRLLTNEDFYRYADDETYEKKLGKYLLNAKKLEIERELKWHMEHQ